MTFDGMRSSVFGFVLGRTNQGRERDGLQREPLCGYYILSDEGMKTIGPVGESNYLAQKRNE